MSKLTPAAREVANPPAIVRPTAINQGVDSIGDVMGVIGSLNGNYIINLNLSIGDGSTIDEIVRRIVRELKTSNRE